MAQVKRLTAAGAAVALAFVFAIPETARGDAESCQRRIVRQLLRFKKKYVRAHTRCLDLDNTGRISGPCPDITAQLKIQRVNEAVVAKIAVSCTMADLAALGYPADCQYEAAVSGKEGQCAALPVTTPAEFAECLKCWKGAELSEYVAILYPSHALEVCGGSLDDTSPACSDLDCTTPLPDQHDLGDTGEETCQRGIGRAGFRYLVKREKILEKCALDGLTKAACLADLEVQLKLTKAAQRKENAIKARCGNRDPVPSPPFCCKTGPGNACMVAASRDDCEISLGGQVQEGKVCGGGNNCDPVPGNQRITWWDNCPESATCPGTALATLDDLIDCVDTSADAIVDELLCFQFRGGGGTDWPCPAPD